MNSTGLLTGLQEVMVPAIIGIVMLALIRFIVLPLAGRAFKDWAASLGWRKPRQRRMERAARKVLDRLGELPNDQARFAYLRAIDPFVFEELILEAFERKGHKVRRNTRYTGDGGIDGRMWSKSGVLHLVQAKRYSNHINPAHIDDFSRVVMKKKCRGLFVHTGRTGKLAREKFNQNPHLTVISGPKLMRLLSMPSR